MPVATFISVQKTATRSLCQSYLDLGLCLRDDSLRAIDLLLLSMMDVLFPLHIGDIAAHLPDTDTLLVQLVQFGR